VSGRKKFINLSSNETRMLWGCDLRLGATGHVTKLGNNEGRTDMDSRKHAILAALVALLFTAAAFGQAKLETAKQDRANVLLRFEKEGTVSSSCGQTLGVITQSMLEVEGVKNAKIDAKGNGVRVSYDPGKTTPQKIVTAFNKENPDMPLQSSGAKEGK